AGAGRPTAVVQRLRDRHRSRRASRAGWPPSVHELERLRWPDVGGVDPQRPLAWDCVLEVDSLVVPLLEPVGHVERAVYGLAGERQPPPERPERELREEPSRTALEVQRHRDPGTTACWVRPEE